MSLTYNRSCLRWPGNKYSLLNYIIPLVPDDFNNYHEPFLGSGAVFMNLNLRNRAYLSDCNKDLINFYFQVKTNLPLFVKSLKSKINEESYYYYERAKNYKSDVSKAAQLYYLNRTCFNGIYRVNGSGQFNVPYGWRKDFEIVDSENLKLLNHKLKKSVLSYGDFSNAICNVKENDFVFLDPPYSSKKENSNFLMYNETLFSWNDQLRLFQFCKELKRKNVRFVLCNLHNEEVRKLFGIKLKLKTISAKRYSAVGSRMESRGTYNEYIFYNY